MIQERLTCAVTETRRLAEIIGQQIETLIGPKTFGPTGDYDIAMGELLLDFNALKAPNAITGSSSPT